MKNNKALKTFLLVLLITLALFPITSHASLIHVDDQASLLTQEQRDSLQQQASELFEKTGFDVIIHTTRNSQGKTSKDYSFDFYYVFRDANTYPDGSAFCIMMDTRDYYEAARGTGIPLLTHRENNNLAGVVQNKLSDGNYYGAFSNYIRYVRRLLLPLTPMERVIEWAPIILLIGLLAGIIYAVYLRSKLKIAKFKSGADLYVVPNSLQLTDSQDIYLYQTVTRTKIQESSGGSGGGRGGGSSSGSRGGTSYGGRGGKF